MYKLDVKNKVPLRAFNTLRLNAVAPLMFVAHSIDDLSMFVRRVSSWDDFYLLGAGSNILIESGILSKPVLILGKEFSYIKRRDSSLLEVGAATPLSRIISYAIGHNLGGLSEFAGIPAAIGGMLACSASSFGREVLSLVEEAAVVDREGRERFLDKTDISFSYRSSSLKGFIITKAVIRLSKAQNVRSNVLSYLERRMSMQDFYYPSAGCIFKNPPNLSAGYLIDKCGFKGFRAGGAQVSLKHANFIVNMGNAKSGDIDYIISAIKERVSGRFGISLEEEIIRWRV